MKSIQRSVKSLLLGLLAGGVIHFALPLALSAQEAGSSATVRGTIGVGATVVEMAPVRAVESLQWELRAWLRGDHALESMVANGVVMPAILPMGEGQGSVMGWIAAEGKRTVIWAGDLGH
jgi:hypothetical protein